jgi:LysR family transcriptional activator of glutamate synthase operon
VSNNDMMLSDSRRHDAASLDQRQLIYFRATARHEHMGHAATELGISESTLSRSIARLESRYGGPLFDRVGRGLRLNAFGRMFFVRVERALSELEIAEQEMRTMRDAEASLVTLGFTPKLGAKVVPELLMRFKNIRPDVRFQLRQRIGAPLRDWLLAGEADLCLAARPASDPSMHWDPLWDEVLVAAMSPEHPLANAGAVTVRDIATESLLTYPRGRSSRDLIERYAAGNGLTLNVTFESNEFTTLVNLAGTGYGIAIVPNSVRTTGTEAVFLPLRPELRVTMGLFSLKTRPLRPSAAAFRDFVLAQTFAPRTAPENVLT